VFYTGKLNQNISNALIEQVGDYFTLSEKQILKKKKVTHMSSRTKKKLEK
jgi:hypothetical protein